MKRKLILAGAIILIVLAFLCIPIPIQTKIVEGKCKPPSPIRHVLKYAIFNFSFWIRNFTFQLNVEGLNFTFLCESAYYSVKMWRNFKNQTTAKIFLTLHNCYGESPQLRFYLDTLYLHFDLEFSEGYETCTVYGYAEAWVPIIIIIYNGVLNLWR